MSRWIDADTLIERWNNMSVRGRTEFDQEIMVAPSIDIVRCAECEYSDIYDDEMFCRLRTDDVKADDFCSYGVKKGADNE